MLKTLAGLAFILAFFSFSARSQTVWTNAPARHSEETARLVKIDFNLRSEKIEEINEIIREMGEMRANFLKTGDFVDIFPTVYYHVTMTELQLIKSDRLHHPLEIMQLMLFFYDSYAANRAAFLSGGIQAVEPQWRDYYVKVTAANAARRKPSYPFKPLDMLRAVRNVLFSGFKGHIVYDLPRAVRQLMANDSTNKFGVYEDFRASDRTMKKAAELANKDIAGSIFKKTRHFALFTLTRGQQIFGVFDDVTQMRIAAWRLGAGCEPLNTFIAQPVLIHSKTNSAKRAGI